MSGHGCGWIGWRKCARRAGSLCSWHQGRALGTHLILGDFMKVIALIRGSNEAVRLANKEMNAHNSRFPSQQMVSKGPAFGAVRAARPRGERIQPHIKAPDAV